MVPDETGLTEEELRGLLEQDQTEDEAEQPADAAPPGQEQATESSDDPVTPSQDAIEALLAAEGVEPAAPPEEIPAAPPEDEPTIEAASSLPLDQQAIEALFATQRQSQPQDPAPSPPESELGSSPVGRATPQAQPNTPPDTSVTMRPAQFTPLDLSSGDHRQDSPGKDLGILLDVPLRITVELGRSEMAVREVLDLGPGSVIELDRSAGEALDVLINGVAIAVGEVVVVGEQFGIRLLKILSAGGPWSPGEREAH